MGLNSAFKGLNIPVTTKPYIPWVKFVFTTMRIGQLWYVYFHTVKIADYYKKIPQKKPTGLDTRVFYFSLAFFIYFDYS